MSRSWRLLRPGGVLIGIAAAPSDQEARQSGARGAYFIVEPSRSGLNHLPGLAETGQLRALPGRVFLLSDAAAAFEALDHPARARQVVLAVRPTTGWDDAN